MHKYSFNLSLISKLQDPYKMQLYLIATSYFYDSPNRVTWQWNYEWNADTSNPY